MYMYMTLNMYIVMASIHGETNGHTSSFQHRYRTKLAQRPRLVQVLINRSSIDRLFTALTGQQRGLA